MVGEKLGDTIRRPYMYNGYLLHENARKHKPDRSEIVLDILIALTFVVPIAALLYVIFV